MQLFNFGHVNDKKYFNNLDGLKALKQNKLEQRVQKNSLVAHQTVESASPCACSAGEGELHCAGGV